MTNRIIPVLLASLSKKNPNNEIYLLNHLPLFFALRTNSDWWYASLVVTKNGRKEFVKGYAPYNYLILEEGFQTRE